MPLNKVSGLNENPEILAADIPERISKELKIALTGKKNLPNDAVADKVLNAIAATDSKLAKLGDRRESLKREIVKMVEALKKVDAPDQDDLDSYGMRITLLLAAALGGKVLMDPRLAEEIKGDKTLLDALNASLVGIGLGTRMALVTEAVGNTGALVFSWYTSVRGIEGQTADWMDTTTWDDPVAAGRAALATGLFLGTLSSAYLGKYKKGVRAGMRASEGLPESDWEERPVRTAVRHYVSTIREGVKRGNHDFIHGNGRKLFRSTLFAGLFLSAIQLADEATNVMGVAEYALGTADRSTQLSDAKQTLDDRQAALLAAIEAAKTSTVEQVQGQIKQKLDDEAAGASESGIATQGPIWRAKAVMYNEDNNAARDLKLGSDFSHGILRLVQSGAVIDGKTLPDEVGAIFDEESAKIKGEMERIDELEKRLSSLDKPEESQVILNDIVRELDRVMADLNSDTQSKLDSRLGKYTTLNRKLIEYAVAHGGPGYANATPDSIEGINADEMSIENTPIKLGIEARSATNIWLRMWHEMGAAAPLTMLALFALIGMLPTNLELFGISPWTARGAQKKRAEMDEKDAKHFEPALEAIVTALDHYLNKGTAAQLLHTEPIDREYIKEKLVEWMEEAVKPSGILSGFVDIARFKDVSDRNARIKALSQIMSNDIKIFHSLLRRILPGMDLLELEEGDRITEATEKNDELHKGVRKDKEQKHVDAVQNKLSKFLEANLEGKAFLDKATDIIDEIIALGTPPPEFDETKTAISEASETLGKALVEFIEDEDAIMGASTSLTTAVDLQASLTELSLVIDNNPDLFQGTSVEEKIATLKDVISEMIIHIAANPKLEALNSFVPPVLNDETSLEAAKLYAVTMDALKAQILDGLEPAAKLYAEAKIAAKTKAWTEKCSDHMETKLDLANDYTDATKEELAAANATFVAFKKGMENNPYAAELVDAAFQNAISVAELNLKIASDDMEEKIAKAQVEALNKFDYNNQDPKNIKLLLEQILGSSMHATVRLTAGSTTVLIDKREQTHLLSALPSLKAKLDTEKGEQFETFVVGLHCENVANGGKPVLLDDIHDLDVGLAEDGQYVVVADMYGNPVLMARDKGHNTRTENQDTVALNPKTGAILVVDGMGGHANGGEFSAAISGNFADGNIDDLAALIEASHEKVKTDNAGKTDADKISYSAGAALAGMKLDDKTLFTSLAGDVRIYIFGADGKKKWASKPQHKTDAPNILTNDVNMTSPVNLENEPNIVESGDRILVCTGGVWGKVTDENLGGLLSEVNLEDPDAVKSFLKKLDQASKGNANNRGLSLTVVR